MQQNIDTASRGLFPEGTCGIGKLWGSLWFITDNWKQHHQHGLIDGTVAGENIGPWQHE